HIAMRVAARLVDADRALGDELLHVAVVVRELGQLALAPQVGAAVAYPGHFEAAPGDAGGDHGGAHRQGVAALARGADDLLVGDADRLLQRRALAGFADDGLARQRAGDLAVLVATHAVGHQPQPQLAVAVVGVLVQFPPQADVGEVSEFNHALRVGGADWRGIVLGNGESGSGRSAAFTSLAGTGGRYASKPRVNAPWRLRSTLAGPDR